jgi:hypothetical protein
MLAPLVEYFPIAGGLLQESYGINIDPITDIDCSNGLFGNGIFSFFGGK